MRLREREIDPLIERELAAIDAALAGRPVEPELEELASLARALREDRPRIDPEFAAELDSAAAEGFPARTAPGAADLGSAAREGHTDPEGHGRQPRVSGGIASRIGKIRAPVRPLRPFRAVAAASVLLLAVSSGVAVYQSNDGGSNAPDRTASQLSNPGAATVDQSEALNVEPGLRAGDTAKGSPPNALGGSTALQGRDRVQERSASLALSADPDQIQDVADGVVGVTDRHRGFVESSSVSVGEGSQGRADFELRIPTVNLQAALADLSGLAHIVSRNEGSVDITAPFVSAGKRFKAARAAVAAAGTAAELAAAQAELAAARAELREIKQRAGFTRVSVTVTSQGNGPGWSIGDAIDDAGNVLEALAGGGLVTLAVLVPLGLVGAGAWFASAGLRRRHRERALDA